MGKKLYIGNLPFSATENVIFDLFSKAGVVETVSLITDRDTGRSRGFGFVEMGSDTEAEKAISEFNGTDMDGRELTVNEARELKPRGNFGGGGRGGFGGGGRGGRGAGGGGRYS